MYNIYRNDRAPNTKDKSHGGVLLPITKDFISSEITELKTNCEIVWAEINITGTKKICVVSYYRPPSDDSTSLDQLNISLSIFQIFFNLIPICFLVFHYFSWCFSDFF
jgi:hypothetical protein